MITKIKIIVTIVAILIIITSVICVYVYVDRLNDKITDLNITITEQKNEIQSLNCQVESLEKNVESFRETISITNDYITNLEKIREEEINTKQEVYQEIINDPVAKEWYDEEIPSSLIDVLLRHSDDGMCYEDSL